VKDTVQWFKQNYNTARKWITFFLLVVEWVVCARIMYEGIVIKFCCIIFILICFLYRMNDCIHTAQYLVY
jgi:hypothetical protein